MIGLSFAQRIFYHLEKLNVLTINAQRVALSWIIVGDSIAFAVALLFLALLNHY